MPEGPEIKYLGDLVRKKLIGKKLLNIVALSKRKVKLPKQSKIKKVETKGKLLWIELNDYFIHITFGISGWLSFDEMDYTKYIFEFKDFKLYVDSMRKFTKVSVYSKEKHIKKVNRLGIDIFSKDFTLDYFQNTIKKSGKMIAPLLLEQDEICGIGNYIKNESLYIAKIYPERAADTLNDIEINDLYKAIKYVSQSSYYTLLKWNNMKTKFPSKLQIPYKYRVYRRDRDRKGNKVTMKKIGGRKTYFVKKIQK